MTQSRFHKGLGLYMALQRNWPQTGWSCNFGQEDVGASIVCSETDRMWDPQSSPWVSIRVAWSSMTTGWWVPKDAFHAPCLESRTTPPECLGARRNTRCSCDVIHIMCKHAFVYVMCISVYVYKYLYYISAQYYIIIYFNMLQYKFGSCFVFE